MQSLGVTPGVPKTARGTAANFTSTRFAAALLPIDGTFASTQAAASSAATLAETFDATAVTTQAAATLAATLAETLTVTAASTQTRPSLAATVAETFAATSAVTQGTPVLSASGVLLFTGTSAATQAAASLTVSLATAGTPLPSNYWRGVPWISHPLVDWPLDGGAR